ncbi:MULTISPECIES: autotransporter domain-containing protein [Rhodomicrobium]|uniref:autotransporter outer membrane beta-barrel domain-containing protein n=1 Tax=Rhodomicrobium TaxID=1068 RepID=UPI000B4B1E60|nr:MULTISPECIES: autotransporter domain-containing protein [Rhodomicrobium]
MLASGARLSAAIIAYVAIALAPPAEAATIIVTNQSEFDAAVAVATQPGHADTIEVNALTISSGAALTVPGAAISTTINFNGLVGTPGSNPMFQVGFGTTGQLNVGDQSTLHFNTTNGIARLQVGYFSGVNDGNGTVNMTGGTINVTPTAPNYLVLDIGRGSLGSVGTFNQSGGLVDLANGALQVGVAQGTGTYNLSGNAVASLTSGTVYFGDGVGGSGTLAVHDNAQFLLNGVGGGGQFFLGNDQGTGHIIQDGAGSLVVLTVPAGFSVGSSSGGVGIGGTGTYDLSAGELEIRGVGMILGADDQGTGIFNQTGGIVTVAGGSIAFGLGSSTYNLDGGELQFAVVNPLVSLGGVHAFNFGDGTIRAVANFSTALDFNMVGDSTINTFDGTIGHTVTFSGPMAGAGSLTKAGAGTLIYTSAKTYTGGTEIAGGTLQLGAGGSLAPTGALQVDAPGTFDLNGHIQTVSDFAGAGAVLLGAGQLTAGTANSTIYSGAMSGTGGFVKTGAGTLSLTGTSPYTGPTTVQAGTLAVYGSIASPVTVNGGVLAGDGTVGGIVANSGATVAPGASIATLTATGSVVFNPGSFYRVETNAAGKSDKIVAAGPATLNGGTVQVLSANGNYSPFTTYIILSAASVSGQFAGVTDNLLFLDPSLTYDAANVYLTLTRSETPFASVARTPNQRAVANALERFPTGNPLFIDLLGQDAAGARQAFDALSGEIHATLSGVLVDESLFMRRAMLGQLVQASYAEGGAALAIALAGADPATTASIPASSSASLGDEFAALSPFTSGITFWGRGFGSWGQFDGDGNAASADRELGGYISGAGGGIGEGWTAGYATGFIRSNVDVGARNSSADVDSYLVGGYLGGPIGPVAFRSGAAWSWHDIDTTRAVIFPGFFENERASYNADTVQAFAEFAYPMLTGPGSAVEPFAGIAVVRQSTEGFTESGNFAGLTSSNRADDIGYSTLGIRAAATLPVAGMMTTPRLLLAWQHAFGDVDTDQVFRFATAGIAFGIGGVPVVQDSAAIEAGVDVALGYNAIFGLSYAGQVGDELEDHGVQGRLTWRF